MVAVNVARPVTRPVVARVNEFIGGEEAPFVPPAEWVSIHDTNLRSGSTTVELNFSASTGNRTIDWGDGTVQVVNTALPSHTYATDGIYTVTVSGGVTTRLGQRSTAPNAGWTQTLIEVVSWGTLGWTSFQEAFRGCVENVKVPNYIPISVTNMVSMFQNAAAFNQPIGNWDTSNITTTLSMFTNAVTFNQDISSWNTSNVTNMGSMFNFASAFQGALHTWDFAKVTNLANFMVNKSGANSYNTTNYNLLLQRWDSQVTNDAMSTSITTNMGGAKHSGAGTTSRGNLVTAGWSITDGGAA